MSSNIEENIENNLTDIVKIEENEEVKEQMEKPKLKKPRTQKQIDALKRHKKNYEKKEKQRNRLKLTSI